MISLQFNTDKELAKIRKALGPLSAKAPNVLASAATATAKSARKQLAAQAQKTYAVSNANFNKEMNIRNATKRTMTAVITSFGTAFELIRFKVNPAKLQDEKPDVIKAKVLKKHALKPLEKNGIKAFMVKFTSGHVTIAERMGNKRLPIKVLYSHGIPGMLGNEKEVYNIIKPDILQELTKQVDMQVDKLLKKAAKEAK